MFGYVRPAKPELKIREYEAYKAVYCSLCRCLGKEYGIFSRFALNYDCTFLVLLHQALHPVCPQFERKRCVCNPLKVCTYANGLQEALHFGATATILMTEEKLRDDIADDGFFRRLVARCVLLLTTRARKKAALADPEMKRFLGEMMANQRKTEASADPVGIDPAADASAKMLEYLLSRLSEEPRTRKILSVLGYQMGRWVYFMDAADDLEKDLRRASFNPFVTQYALSPTAPPEQLKTARLGANELLHQCVAQILAAYHLLEFEAPQPILRNILEEGLAAAQGKMMMREEKEDVRPL